LEPSQISLHANLERFYNLPVKDLQATGDIRHFLKVAPRVRCCQGNPATLAEHLGTLLAEPGVGATRALVLGMCGEKWGAIDVTPADAIKLLVANKDKLPYVEAIFVGDIISEENEISWIQNCDMSPIWPAFPNLREFGVRGGNGLRLGKINHSSLKTLIIETGGLPVAVAREAFGANTPIEYFELWFGDEQYGLTTKIGDLDDLFEGRLFPNLKTLALCKCAFADEIAVRLAQSAILARIEHLDLSLGTFGNAGAEALIRSGAIAHLKSLDISHHYVSLDVRRRLAAATPNLIAGHAETADVSDGETSYYVMVSE
jgi:hypothetical protein